MTPANDSDQFEINSTEIAAGQKVLMDQIGQPALVGGYTSTGLPLAINKVITARKIVVTVMNGGSAINGKAVMTFAGLAEAPA